MKRSVNLCFPLPEVVAERLLAEQTLQGLVNIVDGERVYCVRCLLWRDPSTQTQSAFTDPFCPKKNVMHHCRICGHCVREFDHHCSFFGRCIAGRGFLVGNLRFFSSLITMGIVGGT